MFERFTDRARRVVVLAQEESRVLEHDYIGTEHILLGLIHEAEGVAAQALESLDISLEAVRQQVVEIIGRGEGRGPVGHIPFTPRAKKVLELSLREALQLGHNYIGTEHILLGLISEGEGVAAQVLARMGADLFRVREEVIRILEEMRADPGPILASSGGFARAIEGSPELESAPKGPTVPRCPRCRATISETIQYETQIVKERSGEGSRDVVVVFCGRCGNALGAF